MAGGLISLLMGFLSRPVKVILLCVAAVGFFGIYIPLAERKKKREEQEFYAERERKYREEHASGDEEEDDGAQDL